MKRKLLFLIAVMTWAIGGVDPAHGQTHPTLAELKRRAEVIEPSAEELKWQRIPWMTDLTRGQRVAREERRPLFLWVTGDDPLERC